jgi:hypothetical protein
MAHLAADSPMAAKDREVLALIETTTAPEDRARLSAALGAAFESPEAVARAAHVYALLDDLADADPSDSSDPSDPSDPRIEEAARAIAACLPRDLLPTDMTGRHSSFLRAFFADFAPAQAEGILDEGRP